MDGVDYHYGFNEGCGVPSVNFLQSVRFERGQPFLVLYPLLENEKLVEIYEDELFDNVSENRLPFFFDDKVVYKDESGFPPEWGEVLNFENAIECLDEDLVAKNL